MDRINKFVSHGHPDYIKDEKGNRKFRKESSDEGVYRTAISADWLNDVQEEIISVIEDVGKKPEIGKSQLCESIKKLINNKKETIDNEISDLTELLAEKEKALDNEIASVKASLASKEKAFDGKISDLIELLEKKEKALDKDIAAVRGSLVLKEKYQKDIKKERKLTSEDIKEAREEMFDTSLDLAKGVTEQMKDMWKSEDTIRIFITNEDIHETIEKYDHLVTAIYLGRSYDGQDRGHVYLGIMKGSENSLRLTKNFEYKHP